MAKKRANGEGSLRKRSDGRWEGRYTAGYDPETGRGKYRANKPGTSAFFLVWVLFGSKRKHKNFKQINPSKKKAKSPDFTRNQEIFGRSDGA